MRPEAIIKLYNTEYAHSYNDKFLHSELARQDAEFEYETLRDLLRGAHSWLDVACGTGYFLSRFPDVRREGLDLSPAMLEAARRRNPDVALHRGNFLEDVPRWHNKWDLVSCMWYAYTLADTIADVERLVGNLSRWTSPRGACFLPLCDPGLVAGVDLPLQATSLWPGKILITGITWSYVEGPDCRHENLIAPQIPYLVAVFERYFEQVELVQYPRVRRALVARGKREANT